MNPVAETVKAQSPISKKVADLIVMAISSVWKVGSGSTNLLN